MNDNSVSSAGILMRKEQIAIIAYSVWLFLITFFMFLAQTFDIGIFFVLSLIGLFIIVELITPKYIRPGYLRYIQYILAAGDICNFFSRGHSLCKVKHEPLTLTSANEICVHRAVLWEEGGMYPPSDD